MSYRTIYPERGNPGDHGELVAALFLKYKNAIYRYCLWYLGDGNLADDACTETFFTALKWVSRTGLPEERSLVGWFKTAARFTMLDMLKSRKRQRRRELPLDVLKGLGKGDRAESSCSADPAEHFLVEDELAKVRMLLLRVLDELKPEDRDLLEFIGLDKNSYEQAATKFGASAGALRARLCRLRLQVRDRLTELGVSSASLSSLAIFQPPEGKSILARLVRFQSRLRRSAAIVSFLTIGGCGLGITAMRAVRPAAVSMSGPYVVESVERYGVPTIALSRTGRLFAYDAGFFRGDQKVMGVVIGDAMTRRILHRVEVKDTVAVLRFSQDERQLVVETGDGFVRTYDTQSCAEIRSENHPSSSVRATEELDPTGRFAVEVRFGWPKPDLDEFESILIGRDATSRERLWKFEYRRFLGFAPDGSRFAISEDMASEGDGVTIRDSATGHILRTLRLPGDGPWSLIIDKLAFSPDWKTLAIATCGDRHTVVLFDLQTGSGVRLLDSHGDDIRTLAFTPDEKGLLATSESNIFHLWDIRSRSRVASFKVPGKTTEAVCFDGGGSRIAYSSWDELTIQDFSIDEWSRHSGPAGSTRLREP